jgi:hypothetical protein
LPAERVSADILSTLPPNNGSGGTYFNLTASGSNPLTFDGFATYFASATVGTAATIEVWSRPGSYVGFEGSSAGWTLIDTVTGFAAGTTVLSNQIFLNNPVAIGQGDTTGFYLHSTTTGNGLRYQGTGTTSTSTFSDANLTFFGAHARTGIVPFAGSLFTPRAFSGDIIYTAIPEPGCAVLLCLGALGASLRRRRN